MEDVALLHLRHPQYKKMRQVTVNGISHSYESKNELVRLAPATETVYVEALY
jgi:hypothetical protein